LYWGIVVDFNYSVLHPEGRVLSFYIKAFLFFLSFQVVCCFGEGSLPPTSVKVGRDTFHPTQLEVCLVD